MQYRNPVFIFPYVLFCLSISISPSALVYFCITFTSTVILPILHFFIWYWSYYHMLHKRLFMPPPFSVGGIQCHHCPYVCPYIPSVCMSVLSVWKMVSVRHLLNIVYWIHILYTGHVYNRKYIDLGKIHQLLWELWPFLNFIFCKMLEKLQRLDSFVGWHVVSLTVHRKKCFCSISFWKDMVSVLYLIHI